MSTQFKDLKDRRTGLLELLGAVIGKIKEAKESILLDNEEREYLLDKIMEIETQIADKGV